MPSLRVDLSIWARRTPPGFPVSVGFRVAMVLVKTSSVTSYWKANSLSLTAMARAWGLLHRLEAILESFTVAFLAGPWRKLPQTGPLLQEHIISGSEERGASFFSFTWVPLSILRVQSYSCYKFLGDWSSQAHYTVYSVNWRVIRVYILHDFTPEHSSSFLNLVVTRRCCPSGRNPHSHVDLREGSGNHKLNRSLPSIFGYLEVSVARVFGMPSWGKLEIPPKVALPWDVAHEVSHAFLASEPTLTSKLASSLVRLS